MGQLTSFKSGGETYRSTDWMAEQISVSPWTIRQSRSSGMLLGRAAPPFVKRGRNVFYKESDIDAFLADAISSPFATTADYTGA